MRRKRIEGSIAIALATVAAVLVAAVGSTPAQNDGAKAENMRLVANYDDGGKYRNGTDMAFWGDLLLLGNLDQGTEIGRAHV